jgi:hypothetical protein
MKWRHTRTSNPWSEHEALSRGSVQLQVSDRDLVSDTYIETSPSCVAGQFMVRSAPSISSDCNCLGNPSLYFCQMHD